MMTWRGAVLAVLLGDIVALGAEPGGIPASRPTTQPLSLRPVQGRVDVAALVREVRSSEAWIDRARSFRATIRWTETRPPEMLEARKASYRKLMPNVELTPETCAGLLPSETFRTDVAFDETRILYRRASFDEGTFQTRIWDGKQLTEEVKGSRKSAPHTMPPSDKPPLPQHVLYDLSCLRAGYHPLWLLRKDVSTESADARPEDFELAGEANYRNAPCYVLDCPGHERWFVGVTDHRLHGIASMVVAKESLPQYEAIIRQLAIERTGKPASTADLEPVLKLTPEQQADFTRELARRSANLAIPLSEHWMTDYKQIAPGIFFPMTQGVIFFPNRPGETYCRSGVIAEVDVNQPVPEDLFE